MNSTSQPRESLNNYRDSSCPLSLLLTQVSPRGVHAVFETLRSILHSGKITPRIQYMIEVLFAIRKDSFKVGGLLSMTSLHVPHFHKEWVHVYNCCL